MKHVFAKPYEFEGKTYKEIEFDLENLKGSDYSIVKKQFVKEGNFAAILATDSDFCTMILARLTKQPIEFFMELPATEYCKLTAEVTNFLIA